MSKQESTVNINTSSKDMDIEQIVTDAIRYAKNKGADHIEVSARNDKG